MDDGCFVLAADGVTVMGARRRFSRWAGSIDEGDSIGDESLMSASCKSDMLRPTVAA